MREAGGEARGERQRAATHSSTLLRLRDRRLTSAHAPPRGSSCSSKGTHVAIDISTIAIAPSSCTSIIEMARRSPRFRCLVRLHLSPAFGFMLHLSCCIFCPGVDCMAHQTCNFVRSYTHSSL